MSVVAAVDWSGLGRTFLVLGGITVAVGLLNRHRSKTPCPHCTRRLPDEATVCPHCGRDIGFRTRRSAPPA